MCLVEPRLLYVELEQIAITQPFKQGTIAAVL